MADKAKNVVLNFKMDGQVQYANTLKQINAVMNTAAKEYRNHVAAMGTDTSATEKLRAEKKKLEIQMEGAQKRTKMLRGEYEAMAKDTSTTTEQLTKMYSRVLDAENAEIKLQKSLERVNEGLSDQAIEVVEAKEGLNGLLDEAKLLEAEQQKLTNTFKLQNAELGDNASEAEKVMLKQKQLSKQMNLTDRAVANLEGQLEKTKRIYGENSVEVMKMESKLNNAKSTVAEFKRSLDKLEKSGEKSKKSLDGIGSGIQALAGAAPAAAIAGLVSSMEDYNVALARLRTNASNAGFDLEKAEEGMKKLAVVSGDSEAAVETMSNLMATGFSDNQMAQAIEDINGAAIRFSDTLNTEGIADGIQETFATGEAVGMFGELLERSGVKLDDFNKGLAEATKAGTETDYVLQQMANLGLASAYEEYKKLNPEIVAQREAQAEMNAALGDLSITLAPLVTEVSNFTSKIIEWANENPKLATSIAVGSAAIGALITVLSIAAPIITGIIGLVGVAGGTFAAVAAPIAIAIGAIAALIAIGVALYKNWDTVKAKTQELWNKLGPFKGAFLALTGPIGALISIGIKLYKNWDTIKEKAIELKNVVANLFTGIKWELPKLKLPKISVSGGFSLSPPSAPKFDIKWNRRDSLFNKPSVVKPDELSSNEVDFQTFMDDLKLAFFDLVTV